MKRYQKLLILVTLSVLMLTSCSLLPTSLINSLYGNSPAPAVQPEENSATVTISREEYERLLQFKELVEIQDTVNLYYYQEPDTEAMIDGAAMGFLYGLDDPYTFFYNPEEYATMWEEDEGN
jgi:carboxyl-terminal processing protease